MSLPRSFLPAPLNVDRRERLRAAAGGLIGILVTALICRWLSPSLAHPGLPWLVAPLGASAVLVFGVPGSPLAQPWSVVGGNTISALAGITCACFIQDPVLAGAAAVGLAITLMFATRSLHPPGGAMALITALSHVTAFQFALFPALVNSVLLVSFGMLYNTLTGKRYPHAQQAPRSSPDQARRFSSQDLAAVLTRHNEVIDISQDDLESLLLQTEMQAYQRQLGELRCDSIMSRDPVSVRFGSSLEEAWQLMQQHRIKALPVVDKWHHLMGIVTLADFMRHADMSMHKGFPDRLRDFVRRTASIYASKPEVVGQIMTRQVRVVKGDRHVVDLVPLFCEGGHHHIPIIGDDNRLVGMITQTDFVKALYLAVGAPS